jgi:TolB-like protein/thioredoxin-like negative regulator of GroEL
MLVGEPPCAGVGPTALLRAHLVQNPERVSSKRADVPETLCTLIERLLAKDPANRPPTARDVIAILDGAAMTPSGNVSSVALPGEMQSVAVLPFTNMSADPESEHFADGLTDEIITDLSMLKTLRVISRQSAMRLKGTDKDVRTIARELGTRYVLTGGIRTAGSNLRVTAQLVDAAADAPLWADKYTGTLEDVFDIQERLSRQIVEALRLRLTPDEDRRLAERPIADMRAYEFYLLARQQIWSFTKPSLDRALQLIRQAQDLVGENELLLTAEGLIYWQHVNVGLVPVDHYEEYLSKAEACANRIFELKPDSSKAYGLRGAIRNNRADAVGSRADFKKALVFDRNDPEALLWLGYHYAVAGRIPMARALMDRLQQVDPLTSINLAMYGIVAMCDGDYAEALRWTQRSVDVDPGNPTHRMLQAQTLAANGRQEEAIAILHRVSSDAPAMAWARLASALGFALAGDRRQVLNTLTPDLREAARWDDIFSWWMADSFALVGETEAAIDAVERMIDLGIVNYPFLAEYEPFSRAFARSRASCADGRGAATMERLRAVRCVHDPEHRHLLRRDRQLLSAARVERRAARTVRHLDDHRAQVVVYDQGIGTDDRRWRRSSSTPIPLATGPRSRCSAHLTSPDSAAGTDLTRARPRVQVRPRRERAADVSGACEVVRRGRPRLSSSASVVVRSRCERSPACSIAAAFPRAIAMTTINSSPAHGRCTSLCNPRVKRSRDSGPPSASGSAMFTSSASGTR